MGRSKRHCSDVVEVDGEAVTYCGRYSDEAKPLMDELVRAAYRAWRDGKLPATAQQAGAGEGDK